MFCTVCTCAWVCVASSLGSVILPSVVCSWECFYYCQQRLSWRAWYYTHIHSIPQRWPPLGQISPCTSSPSRLYKYIYINIGMCVCVPTVCPPASRLNQCSVQTLSVGGPRRCQPASQSKLPICRPPSVYRPIRGRSSEEGSVTWVIVVALATGIICGWQQEEAKWTFPFSVKFPKLRGKKKGIIRKMYLLSEMNFKFQVGLETVWWILKIACLHRGSISERYDRTAPVKFMKLYFWSHFEFHDSVWDEPDFMHRFTVFICVLVHVMEESHCCSVCS